MASEKRSRVEILEDRVAASEKQIEEVTAALVRTIEGLQRVVSDLIDGVGRMDAMTARNGDAIGKLQAEIRRIHTKK